MTQSHLQTAPMPSAEADMTRRGLMRTLGQGAMAGALLAAIGGEAVAAPAAKSAHTGKGSHTSDIPSYEGVRNLLATYSFLLDAADYAAWGALFGSDGTVALGDTVWAKGADELAKKMKDLMAVSPRPILGVKGDYLYRHVITNIHLVVQESAGTATAQAYFFVLHVDKGVPPYIRGGGRYDDKIARVDGNWKFVTRRIDFDWSDAAS